MINSKFNLEECFGSMMTPPLAPPQKGRGKDARKRVDVR
jgi:hypothetical protein